MELKNARRGRISEYAEHFPGVTFIPVDPAADHNLWDVPADCAFPCATQNEINAKDAANMLNNGVSPWRGREHADRPRRRRAVRQRRHPLRSGKPRTPARVATSGLEMSQNSLRLAWTREEVDARLHGIMKAIHKQAKDTAEEYRPATT